MNWYATPGTGHQVTGYRWVLDPDDLDQEFKRPKAGNDPHHWRAVEPDHHERDARALPGGWHRAHPGDRGEGRTGIQVAPHDSNPCRGGSAQRRAADRRRHPPSVGCDRHGRLRESAEGTWPTAAELDTFLFTRGALPGAAIRPGPQLRDLATGLFAGYRFDTLGTRTGKRISPCRWPTLNRYRHVIWIVDAKSALFSAPGTVVCPDHGTA